MYLSLKQAIYDVSASCQNIQDLDKRRKYSFNWLVTGVLSKSNASGPWNKKVSNPHFLSTIEEKVDGPMQHLLP